MLTCSANGIDLHTCKRRYIDLLIDKTTVVACGDTCKNMYDELESMGELCLPAGSARRDPNTLSFIDVVFGFVPESICKLISQKVIKKELTNQILEDTMRAFKEFIHEQIWKPRCSAIRKWETENDIGYGKNRQKIRKSGYIATNSDRPEISISSSNNSHSIYNKQYQSKHGNKNIAVNLLNRFIYNILIKGSFKWSVIYKIGCSAGP